MHHINMINKKKRNMIISVDSERALFKIQHVPIIKTFSKLEMKRKSPNLMKYIDSKPTANVILHGEKLEVSHHN